MGASFIIWGSKALKVGDNKFYHILQLLKLKFN
jgi:hypothetical protein